MVAVENGNTDIVKILLDHKMEDNKKVINEQVMHNLLMIFIC